MDLAWKSNWADTRKHFVDWWNHEGLVVGTWGVPRGDEMWENAENPGPPNSREHYYADARFRARSNQFPPVPA